MKNWFFYFSKKQLIFMITMVVSFFMGVILWWFSSIIIKHPYEQYLVERWTKNNNFAQVSIFLSNLTTFKPEHMMELEYKLIEQLYTDGLMEQQSEESEGRLWISAYSAQGTATLVSKNNEMNVEAVGVGGDFFQFHPYYLDEGSYFNGSDIITDRIIIDEDIAWTLFGSNNVVGQYVWINNAPHVIVGVMEKEDDYLTKKAGGDKSKVYISYDSLDNHGINKGINCIEFLIYEQVDGYAEKFLVENIKIDANEYELVKNSTRFNFLQILNVLTQFPTRSMNNKAIIYPVWENIAKGYEDIIAIITLISIVFLLYPSITIIFIGYRYWKNRQWRISHLVYWIGDKIYEIKAAKIRAKEVKGEEKEK